MCHRLGWGKKRMETWMEIGRFFSNYNKHLDSAIKPMWSPCGDFNALVKKIVFFQSSVHFWNSFQQCSMARGLIVFKSVLFIIQRIDSQTESEVAFSPTARARCSTRRGSPTLPHLIWPVTCTTSSGYIYIDDS